jgi:hypothetical protein
MAPRSLGVIGNRSAATETLFQHNDTLTHTA